MGSKSTQSTQIPEYIEEAGKLALERAKQIQAMGYIPYMGPEVAAVNPYEQAAAANVGSMASAFGMQAPAGLDMGGMPTVTQGGMTGYTSYPAYISSLERLKETRPEMYEYLSGLGKFDPITGAVNPSYNMPVMQGEAASNMPVVSPTSGGGSDGGSTAEALERHYSIFPETRPKTGPYAAPSTGLGPRDSSPRPVLRGGDTGGSGGLFGGLRDAKKEVSNRIYTALGGRG